MSRIWICVGISSAVFWGVIGFAVIFGFIERKKHPLPYGNLVKDKYGTVCCICNLFSGFMMFALCSAGIAMLTENIVILILLHIVAWYLSGICTERIFPHINNRLVALFLDPDN